MYDMRIIDFIKKAFTFRNGKNMAEPIKEIHEAIAPNVMQNQPTSQNPQSRRYEIAVYQADYEKVDANGNPIANWKRVNYEKPIIIEASCKKDLDDLQKQYAMCDQRFEILRPLDPPQPIVNQFSSRPTTQTEPQISNTHAQTGISQPQCRSTMNASAKPRIITIGDVQLKYDGDKIYQKQWIKLNQNEATNIRIVNDHNNKIVDLNGKHIEVKKWVLVEQSSDSNDDETFSIQD